jgi:ribonuclease J
MTSLTFYGGVNEIGGNKILLEDNDTKIFLDFGLSFSNMYKYFDEFLQPRTPNGLGDYLELGLLPRIEGLYREDLLIPTDIEYAEPKFRGILPSHPHIDHVGGIPFVDWRIPIYCSEVTKRILGLIQVTSHGGFDVEYLQGKVRPLAAPEYTYHGKWEVYEREFKEIKDIDDVEIEAYEVDHSILGSHGYVLHTSEGTIAYTGDLRLHGPRGEKTREFVDKLIDEDIDVLVIEGTRVEEKRENEVMKELIGEPKEKLSSVTEVKGKSIEVVSNTLKPVFVDFALRDFDTLKVFHEVAKESGRKLVVPFKIAYAIKELSDIIGIGIDDEDLIVYIERKGLGTYDKRDSYYAWERDLLDLSNGEKFDWIKENLHKLIVHLNYYDLQNLIDLKPEEGIYINAGTEPFNEEMALDFRRLKNWLDLFGLKYHYFHASGHLSKEEFFRIVEEVNPKKVIPVHTDGSEIFEKRLTNAIIPEIGTSIGL